MPVRSPPGRARLLTRPAFNGSNMNATTGIVLVARLKVVTTGLVPVTIKSGIAVHDIRSQTGIALVMSLGGIAVDTYFALQRSPGDAVLGKTLAKRCPTSFGKESGRDCRMKNRNWGCVARCCARFPSGHVAAVAPSRAMNWRRLMCSP